MNTQKTPVTMLTEMMVKKGTIPTWELVHDGGGTHQNLFIYRVMCDDYAVEGQGRNKKDAKHEAAAKMLELIAKRNGLLQLPATPEQSPIRKPLPAEPKSPANVPFRNTVGELKDLCGMHNLGDPQYKEIADVGPAHARMFTIQCLVSNFTEEGTSSTKKQAKHEAARMMIDRITEYLIPLEKENPIIKQFIAEDKEEEEEEEEDRISAKKAMEKFPDVRKIIVNDQSAYKVNLGLKIINYHESFKDYFLADDLINEFLEKLENLLASIQRVQQNENDEVIFAELKEEFKNILDILSVNAFESSFDTKHSDCSHVIYIRVNTAPDICEVGIGESERKAYTNALKNVVDTMMLLLH